MIVIDCYICLDKGIVTYIRKIYDFDYSFVAHCVCAKGKGRRYRGAKYYMAGINEVYPDEVLAEIKAVNERAEGGRLEEVSAT